jgi:hypothetical protein
LKPDGVIRARNERPKQKLDEEIQNYDEQKDNELFNSSGRFVRVMSANGGSRPVA